jgi:LPXTG-site transpeptidase (sortase) family protein
MKVFATLFVIVCVIIYVSIFSPVIEVKIKYLSDQTGSIKYVIGGESYNTFQRILSPVNTDFSIIIPKIAATAPIIDEVDPNDPLKYLPALKKGVARALGSAVPGDYGNVYLFAHSADTFYNVPKYNAVFFLLGKLSTGDDIYIYYKDRRFKYQVSEIKVVNPTEVNYLSGSPDAKTLTIQTGYPAGSAKKRLIVVANEIGLQ